MGTVSRTVWAAISVAMLVGALLSTGALAATQQCVLEAGAYQMVEAKEGYQWFTMAGFGELREPGTPRLPSRIFAIGLPPQVVVTGVTVQGLGEVQLPGTYRVLPNLPVLRGDELPATAEQAWAEYEGQQQAIYGVDAPYPSSVGELVAQGGYRKYNLAQVRFTPLRYLPRSGRLYFYPRALVTISYDFVVGAAGADRAMLAERIPEVEAQAEELMVNYDQVQAWYAAAAAQAMEKEGAAAVKYDYVILTNADCVSAVSKLVAWEQCKGRSVRVVDIATIPGYADGYYSVIREFLRQHLYEWGIRDVLLVGEYHPVTVGKAPNVITYPCVPAVHVGDNYCRNHCDYYYAELSQPDNRSWDADGDGWYGEPGDDKNDFYAEVKVGRIPIWRPETVAGICNLMIALEDSPVTSSAYRRNALLLAGFWDDSYDTAPLMEEMLAHLLIPDSWGFTRLYDPRSSRPREGDLTLDNVLATWQSAAYGYVCWTRNVMSDQDAVSMRLIMPSFVFGASDYSAGYPLPAPYPHYNGEVGVLSEMMWQNIAGAVGCQRLIPWAWWLSPPNDGETCTFTYLFSNRFCTAGQSAGWSFNDALRNMYYTYGWSSYECCSWTLFGNPDLYLTQHPTNLPDLRPGMPSSGWYDAITPTSSPGTPTSCPLPTRLPGNSVGTYLNMGWKNVGISAAPHHHTTLTLDGGTVENSYRETLASGALAVTNDASPWNVRGGRHTLVMEVDKYGDVFEMSEGADNTLIRQYVWEPLPLPPDGAPQFRAAPPNPQGYPSGYHPPNFYSNCDGFSFPAQISGSTGGWSAVGVLPYHAASLYSLHLWDKGSYTGSTNGFGPNRLLWSLPTASRTNFVLVNTRLAGAGTYYAGVVNSSWNSTSNAACSFYIDHTPSRTLQPYSAVGWGYYTLQPTHVLDLFECNLSAGTYGFALEQPGTPNCDLAMALYSPAGRYYMLPEQWGARPSDRVAYSNVGGAGKTERFQVNITTPGQYALVVWKVGSPDFQNPPTKSVTYRLAYGPPQIIVTSPKAGDVVYVQDTCPIRWDTIGETDSSVRVAISRNGGLTWSSGASAPNTGQYQWTVSGPASTNCKVAVRSNTLPPRPLQYNGVSGHFTIAAVRAPTNLTAAAQTSKWIRLSWQDNSATETGFEIQRKTGAGGTFGALTTVGPISSYDDKSCLNNTTYYYRVRSYNAYGSSAWSNEAGATTARFDDVPNTSYYYPYVEAIVREGIATGCSVNPPLFCPDAPLSRGVMAVYLCLAAEIDPFDNPTATFADVAKGTVIYPYVEALYREGIVGGCATNPRRFCPTNPVTNGQIAVFLCKAAHIPGYNNPNPTFADVVPGTDPFITLIYPYVEALYRAEITTGCAVSPLRYCPNANVSRGQMAVLLCKTFRIPY